MRCRRKANRPDRFRKTGRPNPLAISFSFLFKTTHFGAFYRRLVQRFHGKRNVYLSAFFYTQESDGWHFKSFLALIFARLSCIIFILIFHQADVLACSHIFLSCVHGMSSCDPVGIGIEKAKYETGLASRTIRGGLAGR